MKNKMSQVLKNEKGLTLIELLAVIVILAIISAIAIPAIGNIIENSRYNAVKADAINVINAANLYYTDNPQGEASVTVGAGTQATTSTVSVAALKATKYLDSAGKFPDTATVSITVPRALSGASTQTINGKTITFTNATIDIINADTTKGSSIGANKTIP